VCTDTTLTLLPFTLGLTQLQVRWLKGILSLGVKQVEYEADPSQTPSAEVTNAQTYTSTNEQYILMENVYTDGTVHCDNHVLKQ
jgi:hypothetical protein